VCYIGAVERAALPFNEDRKMKILWSVKYNGKLEGVYDTEERAVATCREIGAGAELHEHHMTDAQYEATLAVARTKFQRATRQ